MLNAQAPVVDTTISLKEFLKSAPPAPKPKEATPFYHSAIPVKSLVQRYRTVGNLGSGSFGTVTLAKVRTNALAGIFDEMKLCQGTLLEPLQNVNRAKLDVVAIKTMTRRLANLDDYSKVKEVKFILAVSSHPSLVQIYDIFIDKETFKLHIVMESMDQNLYQLMKYRKNCLFSPYTLKSILSQILAGIRHIHKHGYYHRDVKPENVLIMQSSNFYGSKENIPENKRHQAYVIKLADYGLARQVENKRPYTAYVSTRWYRSPEILLRQKHYSYPVDIWAFGCVAVESATFLPLFPGSNELDQTWRVLEVLGCPEKSEKAPLGGFWDDAQKLSSNLGFHLPRLPGASIEELIPRIDLPEKDRKELCDVVKACLVWDPNHRIGVDELCKMSYFKNTILSGPEPDSTPAHKNVATMSPESLNWLSKNTPAVVNDENINESSSHRLRKVPHLNMFKFGKSEKQNPQNFSFAGSLKDETSNKQTDPKPYQSDTYMAVKAKPQSADPAKPEQEWELNDDDSDYGDDEDSGLIEPLYIGESYPLIQLDDKDLGQKPMPGNVDGSFDPQVCIVRGDERADNHFVDYALDEELCGYDDMVSCAWNAGHPDP
ncbi:hypothetical protein KL930_002555 [Ogataea haglerorum]|uniref:Protein kinase domain-containing protein n=1 Tax=Ogataea haglerorum TaxID=1937702 RepID=A0AAN6D7L5_9ASCO|nr:hypothetical protein KL951_002678 [Ogataea haglerorum]KAG7719781.1 hypothetical protein KL913_001750 [Ogataea haglerorum]KAG7721628.1 hypothetical protein KL949_001360 [Ogataea haglerorum]KAG7729261.1 hypothetical protein KL933_001487 [Ogataea haglerorum]KAG7766583.1 hypothetical protein KL946_001771 [Ogataea haglerorum]